MDQHLYMDYLLHSPFLLSCKNIVAPSNLFRGCPYIALFFVLLLLFPFE